MIGLVGGWALRTLLEPPPDVLDVPGYTLVTATPGTVKRSLTLNTSAVWPAESVAASQAVGTVTSVELGAGTLAAPGDLLYTVNLRPVVVAEGVVPAFRDLELGAEGADVAQLQRLLRAMGYEPGEVDGEFGVTVFRAVQAWQRDLGIADDGTVRRGDVLYVPELPARLGLVPDLTVGEALVGGEPTLRVLPDSPTFTMALPENQARIVSVGMTVDILRDGDIWQAKIAELTTADGEATGFVASLTSTADAPICGDQCATIQLAGETLLSSVIHVVPETNGVTVPAAALVTAASGQVGVVLESGAFRVVTVVASASGTTVVEGVAPGTRVRAPGILPGGASSVSEIIR